MDEQQKHAMYSTLRENIIEHLFAGELLRRLWQRGVFDAEILKSEFDAGGYDLVLTHEAHTRHIQLKISRVGGSRSHVSVNLRLSAKPSGCVVWIEVDDDLNIKGLWFFGGGPSQPLPDVKAMKIAKHTKGNAEGQKLERLGHRLIPKSHFKKVSDMDTLLEHLIDLRSTEGGDVHAI
ncbi:hypothetical protein ASF03_01790 [Rhizobium sp. Leaf68]|jgi:hypothetical protein|nr:hypothetical protein ASE62_01635 [Rhizobium sp. Leaf202]KQN87746.1 hypothetical protein ASF03_01790 [Rhizobium sp. Leaf68]